MSHVKYSLDDKTTHACTYIHVKQSGLQVKERGSGVHAGIYVSCIFVGQMYAEHSDIGDWDRAYPPSPDCLSSTGMNADSMTSGRMNHG